MVPSLTPQSPATAFRDAPRPSAVTSAHSLTDSGGILSSSPHGPRPLGLGVAQRVGDPMVGMNDDPRKRASQRASGTSASRWPAPHGRGRCHARDVLVRVGDKWSVLVIAFLGQRGRRFTELLRDIDGISQRMLTVTLRGLERDGLVTRTVHAVVPPRVDYALTPMGRTLLATVILAAGAGKRAAQAIDEAIAARARA